MAQSSLFLEIFKKRIMIYQFIQSINKHLLFCYILQSSVLDLVDTVMSEEGRQHLLSTHCKPDTVLDTFKYIMSLSPLQVLYYHLC